ncbi:recombinase family protein [Falsiroseomonas tokyonensis]|uniref:Recombinase family protein n=2 Tax=Falsiroseomonas tokyonensis TaxID=430521 RepID=A0ABV7BXU4_9PROT
MPIPGLRVPDRPFASALRPAPHNQRSNPLNARQRVALNTAAALPLAARKNRPSEPASRAAHLPLDPGLVGRRRGLSLESFLHFDNRTIIVSLMLVIANRGPGPMIVGYGRVSTAEGQEAGLAAQERDLKAAGCERIFSERVSSVAKRAQLESALDFVREGDVLICTKLDRLARSTTDLLAIVARLEAKGVALRILSMGAGDLDTRTPTGRLMLTMLGAVAEFERTLMLDRQREGIAKAKSEGKYQGRAPTAQRKAPDVLRLKVEGVKPAEIARRTGIGIASVYRILSDKSLDAKASAN